TLHAWVPWAILIVFVTIWGIARPNLDGFIPAQVSGSFLGIQVEGTSATRILFDMPAADRQVQRTRPVVSSDPCQPGQQSTPQAPCAAAERVQFTFNWLSAPG